MLDYLSFTFGKLGEQNPAVYAALAILAALFLALFFSARTVKWNARMLAMASLCIALSFVLSCVRLYRMPQGGSITLASMLPVMLFAYAYGFGPGLVCALAYGLLQFFQDMYIVNVFQVLLDYPLAFAALSLSSLFRGWKSPLALPAGALLGSAVRVLMHVLSGVIFFAEYAEGSGHGPIVYSLIYNLSSVGIDGLIVAVFACLPAVQGLAARISAPASGTKSA
ncbi:MAG: energy-coupled thiamine transporter ThiT [Christensenellaceae bacterium]|jgi:thiamine transporter|nr:energy-coupled thiamine transporter ThiT [Christensenellaceae bacterium]